MLEAGCRVGDHYGHWFVLEVAAKSLLLLWVLKCHFVTIGLWSFEGELGYYSHPAFHVYFLVMMYSVQKLLTAKSQINALISCQEIFPSYLFMFISLGHIVFFHKESFGRTWVTVKYFLILIWSTLYVVSEVFA